MMNARMNSVTREGMAGWPQLPGEGLAVKVNIEPGDLAVPYFESFRNMALEGGATRHLEPIPGQGASPPALGISPSPASA